MSETTDFRRMKGDCMVNYEDKKDSTTWGTETWNMVVDMTFTPKYKEKIKYDVKIKLQKIQGSQNVEKCEFRITTVKTEPEESNRENDTPNKYQLLD